MGRKRRMKDGRRGKNERWEEREERRTGERRGEGRMKDGKKEKNEGWEEREE